LGWLYIVVRVYPFWALPLGVAMVLGSQKKYAINKVKKWLYTIIGFLLVISSGVFLYMKGHEKAVPYMYEILNYKSIY
jgi:hypothetical protein